MCVNGPSVWIGLHLDLRLLSRTLSDTFYNWLKTVLFDGAGVGSASEYIVGDLERRFRNS